MIHETIRCLINEFLDHKMVCIGLVTAHDPQEVPHDDDYNGCANDKLLADIQGMGFEPFPTSYYGEKGYLVPNVSKSALIGLGRRYNQKAVIWGKKVPEDRNGMTFNWQYIEDGKVRGEKISHHPFVCPRFQ